MNKLKILIVDDHPTFREGLARMLGDEDDFECVGQAADGVEAIKMARELKPDVALIDIAMSKMDGIQATKEIKNYCPKTSVIILSAFDYEWYILSSLQAGANGYLLKTTPLDKLISAVRLVHKGESVLDVEATNKIVRRLQLRVYDATEGGKSAQALHPRETEVLELIARGMSNKQIGIELGISDRTVSSHIVSIFKKLGARSRTQAVLYAVREGLIVLNHETMGNPDQNNPQ